MTNEQRHQYIDWYIKNTIFSLMAVGTDKRPLTRNGSLDATRCDTTLHCLANLHPDMNLAIATGPVSGCIVVDIDNKQQRGVSGEESLRLRYGDNYFFDYDNYLWATTPSGGKHLFIQWDEQYPVTSFSGVIDNVDIKGKGGYVLAEPSRVVYEDGSSGIYTFDDISKPISPMLPWTTDLLSLALNNKTQRAGTTPINFREVIDGIPHGRREQSIFTIAWEIKKQGIDIDTAKAFIRQVAANCNPPFSAREAEQKVIRAYSYQHPKTNGVPA